MRNLILQLRALADESRDELVDKFYHDARNSAAFDELDNHALAKYPDWPKRDR